MQLADSVLFVVVSAATAERSLVERSLEVEMDVLAKASSVFAGDQYWRFEIQNLRQTGLVNIAILGVRWRNQP